MQDGVSKLYCDNAQKLSTKSDGVLITGEMQSDSLDVNGVGDISGNLTVHGDLTVNGTTTTVDSQTVVFEDNIPSGLPNDLQELIADLLGPNVAPCELGTIFVSEVNNSGTTENFIEINNSGNVDCSLEGFRLGNSDDPLNYSFGNIVLPAGDFWLGYEGQDSSFSSEIDATADTIILSDLNGNLQGNPNKFYVRSV